MLLTLIASQSSDQILGAASLSVMPVEIGAVLKPRRAIAFLLTDAVLLGGVHRHCVCIIVMSFPLRLLLPWIFCLLPSLVNILYI